MKKKANRPSGKYTYMIKFTNMSFGFEYISEDMDKKRLEELEDMLSIIGEEIWIDRSYVKFHGNQYKDAFIDEKTWDTYISLVDSFINGKTKSKTVKYLIQEMNIYFALMYTYSIIDKYGYGVEDVELNIDTVNTEAYTEYYYDQRTSKWEY